jgi:hypothetical protein
VKEGIQTKCNVTAQLNFNKRGSVTPSVNIPCVILLLCLYFQLLLAWLAEHLLAPEEDFYFAELVICTFIK